MLRQPGIENPLMRTNGKITHWNADKGYGFITPSSGAKQVFVHVRAFRNRNRPPEVNQLVTFELSIDAQGRPCAEDVARAGEQRQRETRRGGPRLGLGRAASVLVLVGVLGVFVYPRLNEFFLRSSVTTSPLVSPAEVEPPKFHCDGRTHCSNMTSCEEATFFIRNCPGTEMDGDYDGVPCESQWCG